MTHQRNVLRLVRSIADYCDALGSLVFVAEVLSPSTARTDRFQKRRLYQQHGVDTVWLVDIDRGFVEVWTPDALFPVVEHERVSWHPAGAARPLVIEMAELLRSV